MKLVMVVYEQIPEETNLFYVHMTDEEWNKFSKLAGKFTNCNIDSDEDQVLADELYKSLFWENFEVGLKGKWSSKEVTAEQALTIKSDCLLLTGIVM